MKEKAVEYYLEKGYSCSESVVQAAVDSGLCDKSVLSCATSFSGGMSSGCLCGAIAGAQMVLGYNFGRENSRVMMLWQKLRLKSLSKNLKAEINSHAVRFCLQDLRVFKESSIVPKWLGMLPKFWNSL